MSWRDLKPFPDDWHEPERPEITASWHADESPTEEIELVFRDKLSQQWYAEWLRSRRGWTAFMTWLDEKR